jgi:Type II secretion system (T2SS), protein M subtype b
MTLTLATRLTPAQSRALAVALALFAVLAAIAIVVVPIVLAHVHYNHAIADSADRLMRYRRVAAQAPEYRKALDAMRARDGRRFFLKNTAANLAGAELQELVKGAIESNGGRITTSQNPQPRDDAGMKQIVANVQFFATTPVLARILYAIEVTEPYLVVDNLSVRPLNAFRAFKPNAGQEPELNVQFDVVGWALPEPGKPAEPVKGNAS